MNDYSELELQEQIVSKLEEMDQERKRQEQVISRLATVNSKISSQVLELQSVIQEQQNRIQEQSDRIVMLHKSDLILKDNERLRSDNDRLQQEKEAAENKAKATISNYEEQKYQLATDRISLNYAKEKQEQIVEQKVQVILDTKTRELEKAYKKKKLALYRPIVILAGYSILVTLLRTCQNVAYRHDFVECWQVFWGALTGDIYDVGGFVRALIRTILPIVLLGIALLCTANDILQTTRDRKITRTTDEVQVMCWLYLSALVIPWAVVAFFGDQISRLLPINLVALHILISSIFLLVRIVLRLFYRFRG